jgi:hypothetical protein
MVARLRSLWTDEGATSDVEYILLVGFVVLPLCYFVPRAVIGVNAHVFDRINIVVNLPFP